MPWSKHSRMTYADYRDVAEAAALAFTGEELSFGTFGWPRRAWSTVSAWRS
jgi:hypothetical protein